MRAILTYHSIDRLASVLSTHPATFAKHIGWLASSRLRVTTVSELMQQPPHDDAVAITFDDGFRNLATDAWPILRDHGLPATVFVVTDHVGHTNAWEAGSPIPRLPLLTWDDLGRLGEEGLELGAHSRTHPDLTRVSPTALADEVTTVAGEIRQRTGVQPTGFAYPYGACDHRVVAAVRDCWPWAVTADLRVMSEQEDPHRLPRLDAYYYRRLRHLKAWGTTRFRLRLRLRAQARIVRRIIKLLKGLRV